MNFRGRSKFITFNLNDPGNRTKATDVMKRFINVLLIAALTLGCLSVCAKAAISICNTAGIIALFRTDEADEMKGSREIVTHNLGELQFHGIEAASAVKETVRSADDPNRDVILRVNENMAERVEMNVRNGILKIGFKNGGRNLRNLTFEVSVPHRDNLSSFEAAGAAQIVVTSPLTAPKIDMEAAGASKITAIIDCQECEAEAAGASKITLAGRTARLSVEAVGASKIDAEQCESINCAAEAVGASKVTVWCTGALSADAVGASKVGYKGECATRLSSVGASSVKKMD